MARKWSKWASSFSSQRSRFVSGERKRNKQKEEEKEEEEEEEEVFLSKLEIANVDPASFESVRG